MYRVLELVRSGRKVMFVRHSKTAKAAEGQTDFDRNLTEEGLALATKVKAEVDLDKVELLFYNPALRCFQTALRMCLAKPGLLMYHPVDTAYAMHPDCPDGAEINRAYLVLRDAPIGDYDDFGCTEAFAFHAETMLQIMDEVLSNMPPMEGDIMFVTHGTMAAAIARHLAQELGHDTAEVTAFLPTECSVITVTKDGIECYAPSAS